MEKKYNFDEIIDRRGTNCYKWDDTDDPEQLPLWVADMDFRTTPEIIEALHQRIDHGIFGYTFASDSYYEAIQQWFDKRHHWQIERSNIIPISGVITAMAAILKALTLPGEKVLVQSPVYHVFYAIIKNSGCIINKNPLKAQNDTYVIDFDDFEQKCSDPKTTVFVLCNPHNPVGRVWTKEELERIAEICERHEVTVIADEIHCELIMPDYHFQPFATINAWTAHNAIVLNSPTKAFNLAGLQISNIVCANPTLRRRINRVIQINEVGHVNPFGLIALEEAYRHGGEWLDELNAYLYDNYKWLKTYCDQHLPQAKVCQLEGTYLVWVDFTAYGMSSKTLYDTLLQQAHVRLNEGAMYGDDEQTTHMRINIACPRKTLEQAMERIKQRLINS